MSHAPGVLKERKPEMYVDFAAGESSATMATKYGAHVSTINYHRQQWEKAGRPVALAAEPPLAAEPAATEPAVQAAVAPITDTEPQVDAPTDTTETDNPPATEEQLRQLAAVLNGQVNAPARPARLTPPTPAPAGQAKQPKWDIKPGQILEGAVARVETNFMLVDIIELADMKGNCPRGRVAASETGVRKGDLRDGRIHEGNVVNVKVLTVNHDPVRDRLSLSLSISQAPPHPDMPAAEVEQHVDPPAPVQGPAATPPAPAPQAIVATPAAPPAPADPTPDLPAPAAVEHPGNISLCNNCIHRHGPFCPFYDNMYGDSVELEDQYKPDRLTHIKVTYGPRPVTSCSAYTSLDAIKAG